MGPAGSGKSTYCATMMTHCKAEKRSGVHLVNLDPAAEHFEYEPTIDIRDLISVQDVMEELDYGPNGALLYCMEFLLDNLDWLEDSLGDYVDDYLIFDCPGQIELYTHFSYMRTLTEMLQRWGYGVVGVYILESPFIIDRAKYFAGVMSAMSAMVNLEIPHINVLSKMDLLLGDGSDEQKEREAGEGIGAGISERELERYLDPDPLLLLEEAQSDMPTRFHDLNRAIVELIDGFGMVSLLPFNIKDEESIEYVLSSVDNAIQYGEDVEPKEGREVEEAERED
ncbi:MAG: GPN-loop GTPase [Piptocephalis tieghemiana]|nr:MAG: GPN-loop GTPase [Piptocephalis tieghemiana]